MTTQNKTKNETGGPAFACMAVDSDGSVYGDAGMTLRDYFAAKAMQAYITTRSPDYHGEDGSQVLTQDAFIVADAMLEARNTSYS